MRSALREPLRYAGYFLVVVGFLAAMAWVYFYIYLSKTRPHFPDPQIGRTIPLNNHGTISYLTAEEDDYMTLLSYAGGFIGAAGILILIVIRDPRFRDE